MAIALAQSRETHGTTATSGMNTQTTGSTFVVAVSGSDGVTMTPHDNKSNTYSSTPSLTISAGGSKLSIWVIQNGAGGSSHTFDVPGASSDTYITAAEITGAATSSLDTPANKTENGTDPHTITASSSLAQADNLVMTMMHVLASGNLTFVPTTGYTLYQSEPDNNVYYGHGAASKVVATTTAPTATWTASVGAGTLTAIFALKEAAAVATNPPQPSTTLPPAGRDFDYELVGFQRGPVGAPNETVDSDNVSFNLPPTGRDFDYELVGFQRGPVGADNSLSTSSTWFEVPIGRDFDYELRAHQHSLNEFLIETPAIPPHYDLSPIGRDYDYQLEGFQYFAREEPVIPGAPISIVQQTSPAFFNNVTSASRTITGVTAGNLLVAFFHFFDVDNSSSKSNYAPSAGWLTAEAPSGPVDINSYMGQSSIYYKENVAGGDHTLEFPTLRSSTYCEITIVEVSGIALTDSLDVHTFGLSPNNTEVTTGSVGPTSPTTEPNSIVFAGVSVSGGGVITNLSHPATSAYSSIDNNDTNATSACFSSNYKILSATGAQSGGWTWTTTSNYTSTIAVFKGAAEAPPPADIAATFTALTPLGRDFDYQLEGFQAEPLADDNDVGTGAVSFEQLPIGRDFDYQLEGYQFGVVGPDLAGDDALTGGVQDIDVFVVGENFDYQLEGFQQGVVGANADQSNVIPMWFEVPQTVVNYGHHLAPYFFVGVGPDGIPPHSEPTQLTSNPPVLAIPEIEEWFHLPIGPDAAPALTSNVTRFYDNPPTFLQLFVDIDGGFIYPGVGPDSAAIPTSEPTTVDDLPMVFVRPQPSYDSSIFAGVRADANFTDATAVTHFTLPSAGKNFDWELEGFQADPLSSDNTTAISATYYELPPSGRDFNYELRAHQDAPLAEENELSYSLAHVELTPDGRNFDYQLEGFQLSEILIDSIIEPVGLSTQHFALAAEGRDFNYDLTGFQSPPVGPDTLDTFPFSSQATFALPPEGRNFDYDLGAFQSPPLAADFFEPFFLAGMDFPAYVDPKHDERDIHPFLGQQVPAIRGEVLPFNNSGPSQYIPTLRPRRR